MEMNVLTPHYPSADRVSVNTVIVQKFLHLFFKSIL